VSAPISENEAAKLAAEESARTLRNVLASLEAVKAQRSASYARCRTIAGRAAVQGEIIGLTIAINTIKRRLRP
jgi:2-keto-4-pentenoate hydratase